MSSFNKTWLFWLRKSRARGRSRKARKVAYRFSSIWGRKFCRLIFRSRRLLLHSLKNKYGAFFKRDSHFTSSLMLKVQVFFFALSLRRFTQLFLNAMPHMNAHGQYCFHYKFYSNFMKKTRLNFASKRRRFWLDSKLSRFRRIRFILRKTLSSRVRGYRYKLKYLKNFPRAARHKLTFYSLFKKGTRRRSFGLFFYNGLEVLLSTVKRVRRGKRKLNLVTFKVYL